MTVDQTPVLGINCSSTERQWRWRSPLLAGPALGLGHPEALSVTTMAEQHDLSLITARLLAERGLNSQTIKAHLAPRLKDSMPDPSLLADMNRAAERLADAVMAGEVIGVFGDYDVDGACGSALLVSTLRALGVKVHSHIPDRMKEGYGPNEPAIRALGAQGAGLVLCVDCGIAAMDVLDPISGDEHAPDIIVLDHHKPALDEKGVQKLPLAITVNPNRQDCPSGLGHVCATTVAFLAMVALVRTLRQRGWFKLGERAEPNLINLLDVVALATICDVMPLRGFNRALVKQGIAVLGRGERVGLRALSTVAGVRESTSAMACGFALGPRINAGGRIGNAGLGLKLLLSDDEGEASAIAAELNSVNVKRRQVEQAILEEAMRQGEEQMAAGHAALFVHGRDWHPGVVGIVAGRLKERFNRPTLVGGLVVGEGGEEIIKGSARSIDGLDIGAAILKASAAGAILGGGGHAMAAGFALGPAQVEGFHKLLDEELAAACQLPARPPLYVDGCLSLHGANRNLALELEALAPFGPGNPQPVLVLENVRCRYVKRIGKDSNTLMLTFEDESGTATLKALAFRAGDKAFTPLLEDSSRPLLHVAGTLQRDDWQERKSVAFFIEDVARA
ncbi:single-stranded-DNA-specific exonuclease RecJ [Formicincola oecophyllae]|uniref:Single-stranded-DNA-specific exonuclease RecJ n=1 Tax=Formicincola oecophyllae TaxID=2558361 RepID=A0A4Y6UA00_9PROT|nr:single-stranded-DNA-specific exonuclease RecJ [Formicincola oecophyllae]QDH13408.1 single-stranded-DNA-specific exonuclease RecJ [Formicincola oecophyllae]